MSTSKDSPEKGEGGNFGIAPPSQSGQLNDEERALFDDLKTQFLKADLAKGQRVWYSDTAILRYLRARSWNVSKALKQLLATDSWRCQESVDQLYELTDVDEYEEASNFCPKWSGRRDKVGRPVMIYSLASATSPTTLAALRRVPNEKQVKLVTALQETGDRFLLTVCSSVQDRTATTPDQVGDSITCATSILDFEGMTMMGFWGLRGLMQIATQIASSHHPETAYLLAIVNVPSWFSAFWTWMKGWIDQGTRDKIIVLSKSQMKEELLKVIHSEDLPVCYGGSLDWDYSKPPFLDEELSKALGGIANPPSGPWALENGKIVLMGAVKGKPRSKQADENIHVEEKEALQSKMGDSAVPSMVET